MSTVLPCTVMECSKPRLALGYCSSHYQRFKKHGSVTKENRWTGYEQPICKVDDCERFVQAQGWCKLHYERWRRYKRLDTVRTFHPSDAICAVPECGQRQRKLAWCDFHYQRHRVHGDVEWAPSYYMPRLSGGYTMIHEPDNPMSNPKGFVFEHRAAIGRVLGRPLTKEENVHHKNGDRRDNRLSNLELWSTSQPKGQRVVDKVAWARDLLAQYGDAVEQGRLDF